MDFKFLSLLGVVLLISIFSSCDSSDPDPQTFPGLYDNGVFVINEGNFNSADGSLSFISDQGKVSNQLFSSVIGEVLGDVVQSAHMAEHKLYIIVNNSNKIEVVFSDSLNRSSTIEGLSLPRYMTSYGGYGYVSEWVSFTSSGQIKKIDLTTDKVVDSLQTGSGAECVLVVNEKLYVSNSWDNTVSVVDLNSFEILVDIEVGYGSNYMVSDAEGDIWVGLTGSYDTNYQPMNDGKLVEIDGQSNSVNSSIELNMNFNGKLAVNPTGEFLYFVQSLAIYQADLGLGEIEEAITLSEAISPYGIGVSSSGEIYIADAGTFIENGTVYKLSDTFVMLGSYKVGRIPGSFTFN